MAISKAEGPTFPFWEEKENKNDWRFVIYFETLIE
jgi:hypothetical protein